MNILEDKFINRFYSQSEVMDAKATIVVFSQGAVESLFEA